jgi:hypothetical protein
MLLNKHPDDVEKLVKKMEKDADDIVFSAQRLSWYMRGGVTFNDLMNMSKKQVDNINEIIKDNLETTKKSNLPFF